MQRKANRYHQMQLGKDQEDVPELQISRHRRILPSSDFRGDKKKARASPMHCSVFGELFFGRR